MPHQIIQIHGGETFKDYESYIAWLKTYQPDMAYMNMKGWKDTFGPALGDQYEIMPLRMPNSFNAKYLEWKIWFEKFIPQFRDGAIFVGNSLGGIFLAKYFAENAYSKKVGALFLVAAPYGPVSDTDDMADFILPKDMSRLADYGNKVYLYQSKDDPIVPFAHVAQYQKDLPKAQVRIFNDKGHFMVSELPEIIEDIKSI